MRFVFVFTVPLSLFVLFAFGAGSMLNLDEQPPDPDEIILHTEMDYNRMAEGYAARGKKQEALDTCTSMAGEYSQSDIDFCLLGVYDASNDIDGTIKIYERRLVAERAAGDSGSLTEYTLKNLRAKRDKKR